MVVKDFLFMDVESGEQFFAEVAVPTGANEKEQIATALYYLSDYFDSIDSLLYIDTYTPEEADALGYDTY